MPTTINVTQEDIDRGVPGKCHSCPVALALQRQVKTFYLVGVTHTHLWLGYDMRGREVEIPLPHEVQNFVMDFDNGITVEPFSFALDIPADIRFSRFSDS